MANAAVKNASLSSQEQSQLASPGPRERVAADASPGERREIVVELPLGHDETVQEPHVEVLEALERKCG